MTIAIPPLRRASAALVAVLLLPACSDSLTEALRGEGQPESLEIERPEGPILEGDTVAVEITVLGPDGGPIDPPEWARPRWSTDPEGMVEEAGGWPVATTSGDGWLRVRMAGLEGSIPLRVHPRILHVDVAQAYLVQTVQRPDGSVPIIAGKDAALRVFARADRANFWGPDATLVLYHDEDELGVRTTRLEGEQIPREIDDSELFGSWVFPIPREHVRPGLRFRIDVPADGAPQPLTEESVLTLTGELDPERVDIRTVAPFHVRFVPIHQEQFGSVGDVSDTNAQDYVEFARQVWPLNEVHVSVRRPFSSSAIADDGRSSDTSQMLREMAALRTDEGDPRYYYGVYRHHGSAGAGRGYVGYPVAVGYDRFTRANGDWVPYAASTFAHELGHNLGRYHAPGCNPPNPDEGYPYPSGRGGVAGFDPENWQFRSPEIHDLMGYCRPRWISDYSYEAALAFREAWDDENGSTQSGAGEERDVLVVWGTVGAGGGVLEPAFRSRTLPRLPSEGGSYRLVGRGEAGEILFTHRFGGQEVADAAGMRDFAFALPLAGFDHDRLHRIEVQGPGTHVARTSTFATIRERDRQMAGPDAQLEPVLRIADGEGGSPEIRWDVERFPLAVLRDAETREIIAFARTGRYAAPAPDRRLHLTLSDGVVSAERVVEVR